MSAPNPDHCVHYNGAFPNEMCDAGVTYLTVARPMNESEAELAASCAADERFALFKRIPCLRGNGVDTCPLRQFPTEAEHAEAVAARERWWAQVVSVLEAIAADNRERGTLPCPACGGTVTFAGFGTRAIRVACDNPGCVRLIG